MAIEDLMNHKGRVWRPTESRGSRRQITRDYEVATEPTVFNARPAPIKWRTADNGPGEQSSTSGDIRRWYMIADTDVQQFDVVEMIEGPETGRKVRVLDASFPGSHHYMLVVEPYVGDLPEVES